MPRRTVIHGERGGVLIGAIVFITIISISLAGVARLSVSHYSRANVERDYQAALYLAEAGINYEMRKVSLDPANADQFNNGTQKGVTYTLGLGSFEVYCTNVDGTKPWNTTQQMAVVSIGMINGVKRKLQIQGKGVPGTGSGSGGYVLYGDYISQVNNVEEVIGGSVNIASGNVGVNSLLRLNGNPSISGTIYFNGSYAGWSGTAASGYTTVTSTKAVEWDTVSNIANNLFPSGGLTWLSAHNDNNLASPALTGQSVSLTSNEVLTLYGKAGGANYYLTGISCTGQSEIAFNNTNGPITVWLGPDGTAGSFTMRGGSATVKASTDPTKPVKMYIAFNSTISFAGNSQLDTGIYAVTGRGATVSFQGDMSYYGSCIADIFSAQGNPTFNYVDGLFSPISVDHYARTNTWSDPTQVNQ